MAASSNKNELVLTKIENGKYEVHHTNGVKIGEFLCKEDGFFDFWPEQRGGYWPSYMLRWIADELDKLNASWEKQIDDEFSKDIYKTPMTPEEESFPC